jgi:predicted DNA-binding helix-hairpin-helix protein
MDIDPKLSWALRNLDQFPVDINKADKRTLARIPGVGMRSVGKILSARRFRKLGWDHLKAIGISMNRSKYFTACNSREFERRDLTGIQIKSQILLSGSSKYSKNFTNQLSLF